MNVRLLRLVDFRRYDRFEIAFQPGPQILTGPNGCGKTTILEALHFASRLRSFRTALPAHLVRHGAGTFGLAVEAEGLSLRVEGAKNVTRMEANGQRLLRAREFWGLLPCVALTPADRHLASGAGGVRRKFLSGLASLMDRRHLAALLDYGAVLRQRNGLLRGLVKFDPGLDAVLATRLRESGQVLQADRKRLVRRLAAAARGFHRRLAPGDGRLDVRYRPAGWQADPAEERTRRRTGFGLQLDRLEIVLAGREVREFASEGQQRTAALALRLAEIALLARQLGTPPVVLADDVFGELDHRRKEALLTLLGPGVQVIASAPESPFGGVPGAVREMPLQS